MKPELLEVFEERQGQHQYSPHANHRGLLSAPGRSVRQHGVQDVSDDHQVGHADGKTEQKDVDLGGSLVDTCV